MLLTLWAKKLEEDMKMKQEEMAKRRSEQPKLLQQQNNVLQQMQLQHVNQRQKMQGMLSCLLYTSPSPRDA